MLPSPPQSPGAPAIEGITLEGYAGVSAAIVEGFPLAEVLRSEGLREKAWAGASLRWSRKLAGDGASGPLSIAFRDLFAFARAWLGRRVQPLEDDLLAWLGFLNAWCAHPAPFDLLDELSISPSDVARIQGAWAQRIEADEDLRDEAQDIARKKPCAVPRVEVTRAELRPFPWTKQAAISAVEPPGPPRSRLSSSFVGDAFGLERYASLHADLGRAGPAGQREVLARLALDKEGFAALEARWKQRFTIDPTLAGDFRRLVRHYEARLAAKAKGGEAAPPERAPSAPNAPAPPRLNALAGTALALDLPRGPALPFVAEVTPSSNIVAPPPRPEKLDAPRPPLGGTALALDVPRGPATPFVPREAPPRPPLAGTALALDVPRGPATPFVPTEAPPREEAAPPPAEAPPAAPLPAEPRSSLSGTSLSVEVPRGPALPFAGAAEPEKRARRHKLGELALDLQAARDKALRLAAPAPALTLEQHASMTAEISMAPERGLAILQRYQLTPESKRAVDEHYRSRVAADASVREAWTRAYQAYHAWLSQTGGRGPAGR